MLNIAIVHLDQGNYALSLDYTQRSLRLRDTLGDKAGKAKTLAQLGNIHFEQGLYAEALQYNRQSLALRQELGDQQGIADTLNSIGGIEAEQGNYKQALEHVQQSLALCEKIGFKLGMASALAFLSSTYQKQGQYALALESATRGAAVARQLGDINRLSQVLFTAGMAHRALKQSAQARQALNGDREYRDAGVQLGGAEKSGSVSLKLKSRHTTHGRFAHQ